MDVLLLGPIEARLAGRPVALGAKKQRALLALLALDANAPVSSDRLVESLWGERPPPTAHKMVQLYVSQLRRALTHHGDGAEIVTRGRGYELQLGVGEVDALRFARLVAEGAPRQALALWRGPPLADVAVEPFAAAEIRRLEELRLSALELAIERDLEAGRHRAVIGEPEALVAAEPLRERLHAQRMLALYRCGRQAEALAAYRHAHRTLVEQIGIEPGPELVRLHRAILAHDPALQPPPTQPGDDELPSGVVTFVLTDIEGSTRLWETESEAMSAALGLHDELIARTVRAHGGRLLKGKGEGDSTVAVFLRASDALAAAADRQAALAQASWPAGLDLRVRIALHTGEAIERDGDYFGPALNRAARLRGLARGGTTVVSQATAEIVRDRLPPGAELIDAGHHRLRGFSRPERVYELRRPESGLVTEPGRVSLELPRPLQRQAGSPLVGRAEELARLCELWSRTPGGPRAVFVAGEPGIGKTRLAAELAATARADGALVLYGCCDEGLAVPYQPFVAALHRYIDAIGPDHVRGAVEGLSPDLARLLPGLDGLGDAVRADPETERWRLFEAVAALLEAATREQPALLVLDDLHWATGPTLLLLRHLIRSERALRFLALGTYRETELEPGHPLARLLADLERDSRVATVGVRGLDARAIAELLEHAAGHPLAAASALVDALRTATGGNPFFIGEVLAHLVESGAIYREGERWTAAGELEVPAGLRRVIEQRVARLSGPARRALEVAAVAGPSCSLTLLGHVLEDPRLPDALQEAVAAGLLVDVGGGEYGFAHALVPQTIYRGLGSARRIRLHHRLGSALEALIDVDAHPELLAHHFAEAAADGRRPRPPTTRWRRDEALRPGSATRKPRRTTSADWTRSHMRSVPTASGAASY
jgi:DNA-binding SARP family transcriptional activator/class 3 adenylate cyclase